MKMCRKMHICEVNGSGYGATEKKISFWHVMTFLKNGRHFEPEVEFFLTLALVFTFLPFQELILYVVLLWSLKEEFEVLN